MINEIKIANSILELVIGDITTEKTDAIVNAANKRLSPGGGVSGAIHAAAGPLLWEECKMLGGCETGQAKITGGYNLDARFVIHTVGPVYSGSSKDSINLKNCYINCLKLAGKNRINSISFPSISTGIFGYPVKEASKIALKTIINFLSDNSLIELVRIVLFSKQDHITYSSTLSSLSEK